MIHPGPFRVKVQPTDLPIEEPSGGSDNALSKSKKQRGPKLRRGVVIELGPAIEEDEFDKDRWSFLTEGAVIYYRDCYILEGDAFVEVTHENIVAFSD